MGGVLFGVRDATDYKSARVLRMCFFEIVGDGHAAAAGELLLPCILPRLASSWQGMR
jgi:hypothetical protein